MKHIRMFENVQQAAAILPTLEYNTLSAIRGESGISLTPGVPGPEATPFYIDVRGSVTLAATTGLQMSTDGKTWTDTAAGDLPTGKTYFRVVSDRTTPLKPNWTEKEDSDYDIGGNINSLVKTSFENDNTCYNFSSYFNRKVKLKRAGNLILPATTLAAECYKNMFNGCTALTTVPTLPATTLANDCYYMMFYGCTSLTTAPALPATTLAQNCYMNMFSKCESLATAPALPATTLANNCYYSMFWDCVSLTTAPALPATTLASQCYTSMFSDCTSLTTAPELPATSLVNAGYCYQSMFKGCTSLTTAPALPAMTLANYCYQYMFQGCTALTSAPVLPAMTLAQYCYNGMFQSCTSLTTAPELPATTLTQGCYTFMFYGCSNLTYIKCLATNKSATQCTNKWVSGVASAGTFVKNPSMSTVSWGTGISGIPSKWTVQDA